MVRVRLPSRAIPLGSLRGAERRCRLARAMHEVRLGRLFRGGLDDASVVLLQPPGDDDLFYLCRPHAHHLIELRGTGAGFAEALPDGRAGEVRRRVRPHRGHLDARVVRLARPGRGAPRAWRRCQRVRRGCASVSTAALHYAGRDDRRASARVLLAHGADRTIENVGGDTAAASARRCGNAEIAAYIDGYPETEKKLVWRRRRRSAMRRRGRNARRRRPRRRERRRRRRRRRQGRAAAVGNADRSWAGRCARGGRGPPDAGAGAPRRLQVGSPGPDGSRGAG